MQKSASHDSDAVRAVWWLGTALTGLIAVLTLEHAIAGAPLVFVTPPSPPTAAAFAPQTLAARRITSETNLIPAAVSIAGVPFTPQAPRGDWSEPFGEACEEAAVLMAVSWTRGMTTLSPAEAEREILGQTAFEDHTFGYNSDTGLAETLKLFTDYYGYRDVSLRYDIKLYDIKRELAAGNVVLVPVAGALLKNPYYISPPPYHMVVLIGYDDVAGEFIAHDPGTRRGAGFRYPYDRLWEAIHDWTGSEETILSGRKGMIAVRKQ